MQLAFTFQFFVRDPDGYYIEFCNCQFLESFLHKKMAEEAKKWNFNATQSVLTVGKKLKLVAKNSKETVEKNNSDPIRKVYYYFCTECHSLIPK